MLWLGVFPSLDLTTSTPDAFCPPLEEARAAVHARVGEVRGDYHAGFSLVRRDDGQQTLELTLREGSDEVLRRELPLDAAGCQDAAQTIALVLERYFDAIERPAPASAPAAEPHLKAAPVLPTPAPPAAPAPSTDRSESPPRLPPSYGVDARAGALYDHELGVAAVLGATFYPPLFRVSSNVRAGIGTELAPFFARQTEVFREREVEAFLLQTGIGLPLTWERGPWRASAGPWFQLRLQRASAPSVENERTAFRLLPGLGGFVRVGASLTSSLGLSAGVAAGRQLSEAASQFVLDGAAGRMAVLVPDAWFGHVQLTVELRL